MSKSNLRDKIWNSKLGSYSSKLVLIAICTLSNESGRCEASKCDLASVCGMSVSTASKAINHLKKSGLLEVGERYDSNGGRLVNSYTIVVGMLK